jgi:hypothetical protein
MNGPFIWEISDEWSIHRSRTELSIRAKGTIQMKHPPGAGPLGCPARVSGRAVIRPGCHPAGPSSGRAVIGAGCHRPTVIAPGRHRGRLSSPGRHRARLSSGPAVIGAGPSSGPAVIAWPSSGPAVIGPGCHRPGRHRPGRHPLLPGSARPVPLRPARARRRSPRRARWQVQGVPVYRNLADRPHRPNWSPDSRAWRTSAPGTCDSYFVIGPAGWLRSSESQIKARRSPTQTVTVSRAAEISIWV